jgi:hydrogenase maturation protein HypF
MGRLFDAVSALTGVRQVVAYEAQAAIELEGHSRDRCCGATSYAFRIEAGDPAVIDPGPVLAAVLTDARLGVPTGVIGARFHRAVADLIIELARTAAPSAPVVALSGGVFQNALLLGLAVDGLDARGFEVLTHDRVPPNDGGLALGQLLVGNAS